MKNRKSFVAVVVLGCLMLLSFVMIACAPRGLKFEKETLSKSEDYNYSFEAYTHKQGGVEISIEDKVFEENTEAEIEKFVDKVVSDYNTLKETFALDNTVKIVVAGDAHKDTGAFFCGDTVYCGIDNEDSEEYSGKLGDIIGEDFRMYLAGAYLKTAEPWKAYGASARAFGYLYPDEEWEYYNNPENMLTLSLFAGYFVDEMADKDTLSAAKRTAAQYSSYLTNTHGTDYFLSAGHSAEDRQAWLDSIGATGKYTMPYNLSWLSGARYMAAKYYPLVIKTEKRTYNISPMHKGFYGSMIFDEFGTPDEVLKELSENIAEVEKILEYIQDNASTAYPHILENYNKHIMYNVYSHTGTTLEGQIELGEIGQFARQTIRKIIMDDLGGVNRWTIEGMAEYFDSVVSGRKYGRVQRVYEEYSRDIFDWDYDYRVPVQKFRDYYAKNGGKTGTIEEFDIALAVRTYGALPLILDEFEMPPSAYIHGFIWGSNLTNPQAFIFSEYLVENFGLDKVLMFCLDKGESNFAAQFGKTYDAAFSQFMTDMRTGQLSWN